MEDRKLIQFQIYNGSKTFFNTQDGGKLIFEPGDLQCSCSIVVKHEDEERDTLSCYLRTADEKGHLWEAESIFTPEIFINRLFNRNHSYELNFFY